MGLINIVYPITGTPGAYNNVFPSQKPLNFLSTRIDQTISTITSGSGGVVKIKTPSAITNISIGDYVSWASDAYSVRSSRVLNVVSSTEIEVDEVFTSSVATNSFVNYKKNWFLEIRYVDKSTTFGNQNAIELFDFTSQVPNDLSGNVTANIGLPAEKLTPDFTLTSGINNGLFVEYKIQYRESWLNNRDEAWISPEPDEPIMLVHGTDNVPTNNFTDIDGTKRFIDGYPLMYSFVYTNINDDDINEIKIYATQYDLTKAVISTAELLVISDANGVYTLYVDPTTINNSCVFVRFTALVASRSGQYSGDDYDGDQYQILNPATGVGFPYTFPLTLS